MWILIVIIAVIVLIFKLLEKYLDNNNNNNSNNHYEFYGYLKDRVLTYSEFDFYLKVKQITDKYDLLIFPKLRMADLITTTEQSEFNKVKSKHIDFTICDKVTKPLIFIELDDMSHNNPKNKQNDDKKDYIMQTLKVKILRIKLNEIDKNLEYIENIIKSKLNLLD